MSAAVERKKPFKCSSALPYVNGTMSKRQRHPKSNISESEYLKDRISYSRDDDIVSQHQHGMRSSNDPPTTKYYKERDTFHYKNLSAKHTHITDKNVSYMDAKAGRSSTHGKVPRPTLCELFEGLTLSKRNQLNLQHEKVIPRFANPVFMRSPEPTEIPIPFGLLPLV